MSRSVSLDSVGIRTLAKSRTDEIVVGNIYFLSNFYDKSGCFVRVTNKSHKTNRAGWPSTVSYIVLEAVGDDAAKSYYAPGTTGTCNASNLYERRACAGHRNHNTKTGTAKGCTLA